VQYICCSHNRLAQAAPWNETNYRHYLAAYYHYVHRVDAEIGLILDALEARPDAEDTLIVFMADHGDGMAVHRMVTKQVSMYDSTTRIPLAFAGPGVRGRDRTDARALASNLDVLPTLCDYAGLDAPAGLWGQSLLPWLQGKRDDSPHPYVVSEWHTEWGFTISPGRMVRTPRFKYTRYLEDAGEELYDMLADPGETRTLIDDPAYGAVLEQHRALLDEHTKTTGDNFFRLMWLADRRWRSHTPGYEHHLGPAAPMVE
jgi:choline-sulfatase